MQLLLPSIEHRVLHIMHIIKCCISCQTSFLPQELEDVCEVAQKEAAAAQQKVAETRMHAKTASHRASDALHGRDAELTELHTRLHAAQVATNDSPAHHGLPRPASSRNTNTTVSVEWLGSCSCRDWEDANCAGGCGGGKAGVARSRGGGIAGGGAR